MLYSQNKTKTTDFAKSAAMHHAHGRFPLQDQIVPRLVPDSYSEIYVPFFFFFKCLNNPCEKTHVVLGCHCLRHQKCKTVQTAHTLC